MDETPSSQTSRSPGEILKDLRRLLAPPGAAFLTQKELAKKLNFSEDYVQRLETGRNAFQYHHVKELELLRPEEEQNARQFDLLLDELRTVVLAEVRSKLGTFATSQEPVKENRDLDKVEDIAAKVDAVKQQVDAVKQQVDASSSMRDLLYQNLSGMVDKTHTLLYGVCARQRGSEKRFVKAIHHAALLISVGCIMLAVVLALLLGKTSGGVADRFSEEEQPSQDALNSGLDAGTALTKLVQKVLPIPNGPAANGQLAAPCPEVAEEINGYCWKRWVLSPAEVKAGMCDSLQLYEPSDGWCRAHHAGYRPVFGTHKRGNTVVDPE